MSENSTTAQSSSKRNTASLLALGLAVVFAAAAFFSGLQIGTGMTAEANNEASLFSIFGNKPQAPEGIELTDFWRVWDLMEDKFVASGTSTEITDASRIEGAIEGLVDSYGDPYTVFLPPVDASQFEEDISGNFSGVGMEVGMRDGTLSVIAPLPDTPAQKAGILAGDLIVRIDGVSTDGMNVDEAVNLIRGEKGTAVVLTMVREGELELLEIEVTRDNIDIPTIDTEQRDDVFIIRLYSFNAISEMKMQEALREYVESGADKIVLDLRGNPGGFLQSAVSIAGYFLQAGKVVVRENFGNGEPEQIYRSVGKTLRQHAPKDMVVLIDRGSASASEILAGALQEHGTAVLIGGTSFGKGSVQELVELPDGSSLKVTIARWLTPDGRSISEGGLTPDVEIERTAQNVIDGQDPQLGAALEYLNRE